MKEEKKHCYNCMFYRPFYTKEYMRFARQDMGLCMRKKVVEKHDVCERWSYNNEFNKRLNIEFTQKAVVKSLDETIKNLTEIGQILRETQDKEDY